MTRIALIEPLGDPGIGTYTYELAEALVGAGAEADVYTCHRPWTAALPRRHRIFPVLGTPLVRQLRALGAPANASIEPPAQAVVIPPQRLTWSGRLKAGLRESFLSIELACWLRARGYDYAWTQWPTEGQTWISFQAAAHAVGLPLVHTAHNVFPHERVAGDHARYAQVYRRSRWILVHSEVARRAMLREFPETAARVLVSPHGLYTAYPRRPEARDQVRRALGIEPGAFVGLIFGGVRPYKNVDAIIGAMARVRNPRVTLVIAGQESRFPDLDPSDRLGRSRRLAATHNVLDRVRFIPRHLQYQESADLFEACDVVMLPYLENYGSGLLLLAMSFGKAVIATPTGGMEEYLQSYPSHVLIQTPGEDDIAAAIERLAAAGPADAPPAPRPGQFEWSAIVGELLPRLRGQTKTERAEHPQLAASEWAQR
jgi:glycosyltransferase involved in cell wall biosynthesis